MSGVKMAVLIDMPASQANCCKWGTTDPHDSAIIKVDHSCFCDWTGLNLPSAE